MQARSTARRWTSGSSYVEHLVGPDSMVVGVK